MEHIVQFGVTIDDEKIEQEVTAQASRKVLEAVLDFTHSSWNEESKLELVCKKAIKEYMNDHMDEVIDKLVTEMAKAALKRKAIKSAVDKELDNENQSEVLS